MYSRGKEKQLNKRKVFFYMEPIDLPCNNCISLPRCIARLKEEDFHSNLFSDVLPFYILIENCSLLYNYFPFKYKKYPEHFASHDTELIDDIDLDNIEIADLYLMSGRERQKIIELLHKKERQGTVYMPKEEWERRYYTIGHMFYKYCEY
jgi:hypothetical protein